MTRNLSTPVAATLLLAGLGSTALAADGRTNGDIRDLAVGLTVSELPETGYLEFACGSNGGPPLQALGGWGDFIACRPDESGLHEVTFRYDDSKVVYNDLEGTAVAGHPVVISLLFDGTGLVQGLRVVTDENTREYNQRRARGLEPKVKSRYGSTAWTCTELEQTGDEKPVGGIFVKRLCEISVSDRWVEMITKFYRNGEGPKSTIVNSCRFEVWYRPGE